MRWRTVLGGMAVALASAGAASADDTVKLGFITKFPVPFFATMENAAKEYGKCRQGVCGSASGY
jgi:ribose transport system substrate-binding protein